MKYKREKHSIIASDGYMCTLSAILFVVSYILRNTRNCPVIYNFYSEDDKKFYYIYRIFDVFAKFSKL